MYIYMCCKLHSALESDVKHCKIGRRQPKTPYQRFLCAYCIKNHCTGTNFHKKVLKIEECRFKIAAWTTQPQRRTR